MPRRKQSSDDAPEVTPEMMRQGTMVRGGIENTIAHLRRHRGPQRAPTKQLVSLRLSRDVLEAYRASGPGWQSRIDADLRVAAHHAGRAHQWSEETQKLATPKRATKRKTSDSSR